MIWLLLHVKQPHEKIIGSLSVIVMSDEGGGMQGVTNQANSSLKSILEQHGISGTPTLLQQLVGPSFTFTVQTSADLNSQSCESSCCWCCEGRPLC